MPDGESITASQRPTRRPAADGESESFRVRLLASLGVLRAFAATLTGGADGADDLVQDTLLKAWGARAQFTLGTDMDAWLFTILRNHYYSQLRKQGREVQDGSGFYSGRFGVAPAQDGVRDLADFARAFARLPLEQREALLLVGASGLGYGEAAAVCGCATGTVKSRVSRARARLQAELGIESAAEYGPDLRIAPALSRAFASRNGRARGAQPPV